MAGTDRTLAIRDLDTKSELLDDSEVTLLPVTVTIVVTESVLSSIGDVDVVVVILTNGHISVSSLGDVDSVDNSIGEFELNRILLVD